MQCERPLTPNFVFETEEGMQDIVSLAGFNCLGVEIVQATVQTTEPIPTNFITVSGFENDYYNGLYAGDGEVWRQQDTVDLRIELSEDVADPRTLAYEGNYTLIIEENPLKYKYTKETDDGTIEMVKADDGLSWELTGPGLPELNIGAFPPIFDISIEVDEVVNAVSLLSWARGDASLATLKPRMQVSKGIGTRRFELTMLDADFGDPFADAILLNGVDFVDDEVDVLTTGGSKQYRAIVPNIGAFIIKVEVDRTWSEDIPVDAPAWTLRYTKSSDVYVFTTPVALDFTVGDVTMLFSSEGEYKAARFGTALGVEMANQYMIRPQYATFDVPRAVGAYWYYNLAGNRQVRVYGPSPFSILSEGTESELNDIQITQLPFPPNTPPLAPPPPISPPSPPANCCVDPGRFTQAYGSRCTSARYGNGNPSPKYCHGQDANGNPTPKFDWFATCCEWTGSECVDLVPDELCANPSFPPPSAPFPPYEPPPSAPNLEDPNADAKAPFMSNFTSDVDRTGTCKILLKQAMGMLSLNYCNQTYLPSERALCPCKPPPSLPPPLSPPPLQPLLEPRPPPPPLSPPPSPPPPSPPPPSPPPPSPPPPSPPPPSPPPPSPPPPSPPPPSPPPPSPSPPPPSPPPPSPPPPSPPPSPPSPSPPPPSPPPSSPPPNPPPPSPPPPSLPPPSLPPPSPLPPSLPPVSPPPSPPPPSPSPPPPSPPPPSPPPPSPPPPSPPPPSPPPPSPPPPSPPPLPPPSNPPSAPPSLPPPPITPADVCYNLTTERTQLPVGDLRYCGNIDNVDYTCENFYFAVISNNWFYYVPCQMIDAQCKGSEIYNCEPISPMPPPSPKPPSLPLFPTLPPLNILGAPPPPASPACPVSSIARDSTGVFELNECNGDSAYVGYIVDSDSVFAKSIYLPKDLPAKKYRADVVLYNAYLSVDPKNLLVSYSIDLRIRNTVNGGINVTVQGIGAKGYTLDEVGQNLSPDDFSVGFINSNGSVTIETNAIPSGSEEKTIYSINVTDYMNNMLIDGNNNQFITFRITASTINIACFTRSPDCYTTGYLLDNFEVSSKVSVAPRVVCEVMCAGRPRDENSNETFINTCCDLPLLNGAAFAGIVGEDQLEQFALANDLWDDAVLSDNVLVIYSFLVPRYSSSKQYILSITIAQRFDVGIPLRVDSPTFVSTETIDQLADIVDEADVFYDSNSTGNYIVSNNAIPMLALPNEVFNIDLTEFVRYLNNNGLVGRYVPLRIISTVDLCSISPCLRTTGYALDNISLRISEGSSSLSSGEIAAIVIGSIILLALVMLLLRSMYANRVSEQSSSMNRNNTIPTSREGTYYI